MKLGSHTMRGLPSVDATYDDGLRVIAEQLDSWTCWVYQRAYHFVVADGWTIALALESAGRFRIDLCRWTRPVRSMWCFEDDRDRLAGIVAELREHLEGVREGV